MKSLCHILKSLGKSTILTLVLLISGCRTPEVLTPEQEEFIKLQDFGFYYNNTPQLIYDEEISQYSVNKKRNQFRIQNGDQSLFFNIILQKDVKREKQVLEVTYHSLRFGVDHSGVYMMKVLKIEYNKIWLWEEGGINAMIIPTL